MFYPFSREYILWNKIINMISFILAAIFILICLRIVYFVWCMPSLDSAWKEFWRLPYILATLLAVCASQRLILFNKEIKEKDYKDDIVNGTHHLIAVLEDLKSKISYAKKIISTNDKYPNYFLVELCESIESRYEVLFTKETYKYISGTGVNKINKMSGNIFGLTTLAVCLKEKEPNGIVKNDSDDAREKIIGNMNDLITGVDFLLDMVFETRERIN